MKSDHADYNLKSSIERINQIIAANDGAYEQRDSIPARSDLSYTNGYYVKCSVLCVNIREPAELHDFYKSIVLAKIYRAYVSEVAAIINGNPKCAEINISGDHVCAVFDTPYKDNVNEVFSTGTKISSIIDIMNYKFKKNSMKEIVIGVGMSYGKALVIKTSYKGSRVEEAIWMGDVVKEATTLASYGNNESTDKEIMVSEVFYYNMDLGNRALLEFNETRNCYHGNVLNSYMNAWYKQNCQ